MLIKREDCCLLVIDVQERLLPAMYDPAGIADRCRDLLATAQVLGIPVLVTEHYPRGIGATAAALCDYVAPGAVVQKIHFSGFTEPQVRQRIRAAGKGTLILAGMEAHVCLGQTALDLLSAGYRIVVSADATASRTRLDHETALHRLSRAGAHVRRTADIIDAWRAADVAAGAAPAHVSEGRGR